VVESPKATYRVPHLVVATGHARVPQVPTWPGQELFGGEVLHSRAYRNGAPYRGRRVLVVGFGNSAGEIALDLAAHGAAPTLAVRGPVNVLPRDLLGLPLLAIAGAMRALPPEVGDRLAAPLLRLRFGDLGRYGLEKAPYGPRVQVVRHGRVPLIDVGTLAAIRAGRIAVRPGVARFTRAGVVFEDGRAEAFDAVVHAPGAVDAAGVPVCSGGRAAAPGLYFCGFHVSPGGMLDAIRREAPAIAAAVAAGRGRESA
jgi:cation diffusion facilitator CzcD-associated flavoprotein CzcO